MSNRFTPRPPKPNTPLHLASKKKINELVEKAKNLLGKGSHSISTLNRAVDRAVFGNGVRYPEGTRDAVAKRVFEFYS